MKEQMAKESQWICDKCKRNLEQRTVKATYLGGNFEVQLFKCPECNHVYISDELALGKMLEVEKALEEK